jgi:hypothetical protein
MPNLICTINFNMSDILEMLSRILLQIVIGGTISSKFTEKKCELRHTYLVLEIKMSTIIHIQTLNTFACNIN